MDTNNGRLLQSRVEPAMVVDTGEWRSQLQPDSRQRIVHKIMDTLKRHLPFSGQEGLHELKKIAVRFEEKIYTAATSKSDYLRKISLKMLTMESKSQNRITPNSVQINSTGNSNRPPEPESETMDTSGADWQGEVYQKGYTNNGRPPQSGGEPAVVVDTGEWRSQLQPDSRQRIIHKIMDILKRHQPFSGLEGLNELKKIAVKFEEKIYTAATSKSDYLRKISLKMLTMENKSQNTITNSLQSNSAGNSNRPPEPGTAVSTFPVTDSASNYTDAMLKFATTTVTPATTRYAAKASTTVYNTPKPVVSISRSPSGDVIKFPSPDWTCSLARRGLSKVMKKLYSPKPSEMYWKAVIKLQQEDSCIQQLTPDQHANLNMLKIVKNILERVISLLHISKAYISVGFMEKLVSLEQHILTLQSLLNTINPDIL